MLPARMTTAREVERINLSEKVYVVYDLGSYVFVPSFVNERLFTVDFSGILRSAQRKDRDQSGEPGDLRPKVGLCVHRPLVPLRFEVAVRVHPVPQEGGC